MSILSALLEAAAVPADVVCVHPLWSSYVSWTVEKEVLSRDGKGFLRGLLVGKSRPAPRGQYA